MFEDTKLLKAQKTVLEEVLSSVEINEESESVYIVTNLYDCIMNKLNIIKTRFMINEIIERHIPL